MVVDLSPDHNYFTWLQRKVLSHPEIQDSLGFIFSSSQFVTQTMGKYLLDILLVYDLFWAPKFMLTALILEAIASFSLKIFN